MESAAGKQAVKEFFIQIRKSFNEMVSSFAYSNIINRYLDFSHST